MILVNICQKTFFFKLKITNTGAIEHKIVYSKPVKEAPRQIIEEELSSHNDSTKHTLQKDFMHFMLPYENISIYYRFWLFSVYQITEESQVYNFSFDVHYVNRVYLIG